MKKALLFVAFMLCCAMTMFAQNNKISYQAVVRDAQNKLVSNQPVTVTVSIFNGSTTSAAYSETQTATTNINGLISLLVGNGTVTGGNWESIDWKTARVETTVSLNGATLGTLEMPFTAVPYAMYAEHAAEIDPDAAVVTGIYNKILYDSLALGLLIDANTNNINTLANRVNTFNTHVCDSVKECVKGWVHDSITGNISQQIRDSIAASLADYDIKNCNDVKNCVAEDFRDVYVKIHGDSIALGALIDAKANAADVYTKNEVYNKTETNQLLNAKANAADVYTQAQINAKLSDTVRYATKTKVKQDSLDICALIPAAQVQSNWTQTNIAAVDYIKNKPNIDNIISTYLTNNNYIDQATLESYNYLTSNSTVITDLQTDVTNMQNTYATIDALTQQIANVFDSLNKRIDSLSNVTKLMPTMEQETFILTGTTGEFQLQHAPNASCIYRMYINGVMVGGSNNEVLKLKTGTTNTLEYDATKNGNYTLKADDKVTIVYWY